MIANVSKSIYLKRLKSNDVTEDYVSWLNNPQVNQYLESKYIVHTLETVTKFVQSVDNDNNYLFGIFDKLTDKHIGNIKLGNIDFRYSSADIGFLIGDTDFWGKGVATNAIEICVNFAFKELNLHRVWGGVYANNIGSHKAFIKSGFMLEGINKDKVIYNEKYMDCYMYSIINKSKSIF